MEGSGAPSFSPFEKRVLCFIRMSIISRSVKHIERSECGKDLRSDETQHCFGSLRYTVLLSCSHSNRFRSLIYPRTFFLSLNLPFLAPERRCSCLRQIRSLSASSQHCSTVGSRNTSQDYRKFLERRQKTRFRSPSCERR